MINWFILFRKRVINGFNRAFYLGAYKNFPVWCSANNIQFDIDFYDKDLKDRPIAHIERCKIKVGDLRTCLFGLKYPMGESLVYKSLTGDVPYSKYRKMLDESGDLSHHDAPDNHSKQVEDWVLSDEAISKNWPIIVNPKNYILDGQHRACAYLHKFGENHKVNAVRIYTLPATGSLLQKIIKRLLPWRNLWRWPRWKI